MPVLKFELAGQYPTILVRVRSDQGGKTQRQIPPGILVLLVNKRGVCTPLFRLIFVWLATIYSWTVIALRIATRSRKNRLLPTQPWDLPIWSAEGAFPAPRSSAPRNFQTRFHHTLMDRSRFRTRFSRFLTRLLISQGFISLISFYEKRYIS